MNAPTEKFALARRGLPLATAAHATLRGAWLPAVSRNRAVAFQPPSPATTLPAPIEPEDSDDWRAEAMEWVPSEDAQSQPPAATGPVDASTATPTPRRVDESAPGVAPAFVPPQPQARAQGPAEPAAPSSKPAAEKAEAPATSTKPTLLIEPMASPAAPAAIAPPATAVEHQADASLHPQDQAPQAHGQLPATATQKHTPAPAPLPSVVAPLSPTPRLLIPVPQHEHALQQRTEPMQQPSATRATAAPQPVAPAIKTAPIELTALLPPTATPAEPAPAGPALLAQAQPMGVPTETAPDHRPAPAVDIATLLAPPASHRAELRIDRVSVTVQSPATAAATTAPSPAAAAAAARASAPPARVFRNPWAGYHARRD